MITRQDLLKAGWNCDPNNIWGLPNQEWYMSGPNGLHLRNLKHSVRYDDFEKIVDIVEVITTLSPWTGLRLTEVNTIETIDTIDALLAYMQANGEEKSCGYNVWD